MCMWKSLAELFSENKGYKEGILAGIKNNSLSIFMHVDEAELYKITALGNESTLVSTVGGKMMEIYPFIAISVLRGEAVPI